MYLDTMILYTFVRAEMRIRPTIRTFFSNVEQGHIRAYTSTLTFDELAYGLTLAAIRDQFTGSPLDRLRHEEQQMLSTVYPTVLPTLRALHHFPGLQILDANPNDLTILFALMESHQLKPRDALYVATMRKIGCQSIASNAPHFDRVPEMKHYAI